MRNRQLVRHVVLNETPAERALARGLVTEIELVRLKAIARLYAWGLPPDMGWADLLQEALLRVLQGSRRRPDNVSMIAFVTGIMRSLKAEQHRRRQREAPSGSGDNVAAATLDPAPDAERSLAARQELAAIYRLFADDAVATRILNGLGSGLSPEEICAANGLSRTDYESARRRMRRCLLRHNLAWRLR